MSPSSTTPSSGGGHSPEDQFRVVRKRNRVPLSCYPCRTRKLKCDRSHPCSNCVKREGAGTSACSYASPSSRKKNQSQGAPTPDDMQNRIDRLEGLVLTLMHGGASTDPSSAAAAAAAAAASAATASSTADSGSSRARHDVDGMRDEGEGDSDIEDGLATSLGILKVDADHGKAMYIGQEHWHSILADITEVKNYYMSHKTELERSYMKVMASKPQTAREGPTILLGATAASEVELRAELPPKSSVLTLCGRYFNSMDNAVVIIHPPSFHQQLKAHWQDPSKSPIMWLGLLYSILCLAMLSYHKVGDEPPEWKGRTLELAAEYRLRTVQCLMAGDYTKPSEYTVETMLLYVFGEYSARWDADMALWLINSLISRLALRMGYHRDGKWFPSISPFQAEMRRRTWALVRMADVIFSHQVSLPSMIYENDCDTALPSNLFDEEFGPETKVLPPSRPSSEPTPISYMISKIRLCLELGNILQATSRVRNQVHYDEILRFDARLREIKEELPPHLKMQPLESCRDPLTLIIARFSLDILYLKVMCLLHRKYVSRTRHNPRYAHSRRSAIEASMETLRHLGKLHRESQPNGRLRSIKWYVSSIATKDFLLPAMLVVLDLHHDSAAATGAGSAAGAGADDDDDDVDGMMRHDSTGSSQAPSEPFWTPEQRAEMVRTLEVTQAIWAGLADSSMEAVKASSVLRLMLDRISQQAPPPRQQASSRQELVQNSNLNHITPPSVSGGEDSPFGRADLFAAADLQPEHSAAMTLGMLSGGGVSPMTAALGGGGGGGSIQSPGGTPAYPARMDVGDVGVPPSSSGVEASALTDFSSGFLGLSGLGVGGPASPFSSMFGAIAGPEASAGPMEFTSSNFDWDSLENYTQTANWGTDHSFQFFPANPDEQGSSESNTLYTPSTASSRPT